MGVAAQFGAARDIAVDAAGNLYIADSANQLVRKASLSGGEWTVTTLGGVPGQAGATNGVGMDARFNQPSGIAVDAFGSVYVVNAGTYTITKGTLGGTTVTPKVEFDTASDAVTYANDSLQLRLTSATSGSLILEISTNLQSWQPFRTNPITPPNLIISLPATNQNSFFRATLRP